MSFQDSFSAATPYDITMTGNYGLGIIIALISIVCLVVLAARVLFALAVYYDARSKYNTDALLWALLVGFVGLIPGIVYLCIRNTVKNYVVCQNCGVSHFSVEPVCPRCGAPNPYAPAAGMNLVAEKQARQAKTLLIIGIILYVLAIAVLICGIIIGFAAISY